MRCAVHDDSTFTVNPTVRSAPQPRVETSLDHLTTCNSDFMYSITSVVHDFLRRNVIQRIRNQFTRFKKIIESGETPFKSVEIITNTPESKLFFERMMELFEVPGTVRLAI